MDLRFRIVQKEDSNMSSLVKQMCALQCRIKVDNEEGTCSIWEMDDNKVESVIESINEAFNILSVDIIPTVQLPESEEPVVTAESLDIPKIEFSDSKVEEHVNKLMRIIYWAMYSNKASSKDICMYLKATGAEIAMKYNSPELVEFSIGDVVACNYGTHMSGEISGGHVHSIVCDKDDGTIYVVPITKNKLEEEAGRYLPMQVNSDVDYIVAGYNGGTALLKKGRYIRPERIKEVVGSVRPRFFTRLLESLPGAIHFSHNDFSKRWEERNGDVENDDVLLEFNDVRDEMQRKGGNPEALCQPFTKVEEEKLSPEESISAVIAEELDKLDKSVPAYIQINAFLEGIGFSTDEVIRRAFEVACDIKRINFITITHELDDCVAKEQARESMREAFREWIAKYPDIKAMYPNVSFMSLVKVFVKRMR